MKNQSRILITMAILSGCNQSAPLKVEQNITGVENSLSSWSISNGLTQYHISKCSEGVHNGQSACVIESAVPTDSFNGIVQSFIADNYRGKRVRFNAYLKSENIEGSGAIWMRADSDSGIISFDNLSTGHTDRSVKGSSEWKKYEIVLDIPLSSQSIYIGAYLSGKGKLWIDDMSLAMVDPAKVEVTGESYQSAIGVSGSDISGNDDAMKKAMKCMLEESQYDKEISKRAPMNLGFED